MSKIDPRNWDEDREQRKRDKRRNKRKQQKQQRASPGRRGEPHRAERCTCALGTLSSRNTTTPQQGGSGSWRTP